MLYSMYWIYRCTQLYRVMILLLVVFEWAFSRDFLPKSRPFSRLNFEHQEAQVKSKRSGKLLLADKKWDDLSVSTCLLNYRKSTKDQKIKEDIKKKRKEEKELTMKKEDEKYEKSIECAERYQEWVEKKGKPRRGPPPPTLTQRWFPFLESPVNFSGPNSHFKNCDPLILKSWSFTKNSIYERANL